MMKTETNGNQQHGPTKSMIIGVTHLSKETTMRLSQETFTKDNKLVFTEDHGDKVIQLYSYGF